MARVAVVGVGAVGGVVAASLEDAGHEVVLCVRRPIADRLVERAGGAVALRGTEVLDPDRAPAVDWVLVATKAYDAQGTARWFPRLRAGGAPVAILQNGVEHRERFARYLPPAEILPVVVAGSASRAASGRTVQRGAMSLAVPEGPLGRSFVGLLAAAPLRASTVDDFPRVAWEKLCRNAVGILPALVLRPAGVMRREDLGEVARQIVRECVAVARAEGVPLADAVVEDVLAAVRASSPDSVNSLHADRLAGRPTEVDARNGVVVRLGRRHGVATPANEMAVALLGAMTEPG